MSKNNNEKNSRHCPSLPISSTSRELHEELKRTDAPTLDDFAHPHHHGDSKIGSPLGLWSPKTSPLNGKAAASSRPSSTLPHHRHNHSHDDLSVNLFTGSFDTSLTEQGLRATFDRDPPPLSPPSVAARSRDSTMDQRDSDIALPELKHPPHDLDGATFGDISPIKVSYSDVPPPHLEARHEPFEHEDEHWPCDSNGNVQAPVSNPFYVLRFAASAFANVKYILPCLKDAETCPVNMNTYGQIRQYKPKGRHSIPLIDTKIATMRVEAAICAFGGTLHQRHSHNPESIFRVKNHGAKSFGRRLYDQKLPHRFVLTGSKISWDFEEEPPIVIPPEDERDDTKSTLVSRDGQLSVNTGALGSSLDDFGNDSQNLLLMDSNNNKMKYRCKMCGQLKNNHVCPYRQPLQRSIGVMVYPAVNSFTAFEPGTIAPPLTKMNNFVSYDSDQTGSAYRPEGLSSSLAQGSSSKRNPPHPTTVTPEAFPGVGGLFHHSPQSSLSNHSEDGAVPSETHTEERPGNVNYEKRASRKRLHEQVDTTSASADAITKDDSISAKRTLFVTAVALKPEHYRSVTQSAREDSSHSYQYASIPLTFAERKRLSDTLFVLSKEIPTMTTACAGVLREARENNEWDLAVAELMTQVIVGLFCTEEDLRLEGLRRYLLTLGFAC